MLFLLWQVFFSLKVFMLWRAACTARFPHLLAPPLFLYRTNLRTSHLENRLATFNRHWHQSSMSITENQHELTHLETSVFYSAVAALLCAAKLHSMLREHQAPAPRCYVANVFAPWLQSLLQPAFKINILHTTMNPKHLNWALTAAQKQCTSRSFSSKLCNGRPAQQSSNASSAPIPLSLTLQAMAYIPTTSQHVSLKIASCKECLQNVTAPPILAYASTSTHE